MPLLFLLLFIAVPIIEIALFIQVGGFIGLWPTLGIVILTAFAGTFLLRLQGLAALQRLQTSLNEGGNPVDPIVHGALILAAGLLLLTPGFFTDAVGFCLLVPPIRSAIIRWGAVRFVQAGATVHTQTTARPRDPGAVEGDFVVLDDNEPPNKPGDSGWTKPG
ncbi:MAG: FxsA family protein [Pseudomonadota bacterium]